MPQASAAVLLCRHANCTEGVDCRSRFARRAAVGLACRLEPPGCADGDHRRAARVDGLDDLGVVDPLQVDRRDAEVAVAELALYHDRRYTFTRLLDAAAQHGARHCPRVDRAEILGGRCRRRTSSWFVRDSPVGTKATTSSSSTPPPPIPSCFLAFGAVPRTPRSARVARRYPAELSRGELAG